MEKINWTRINNDANGNPRYVCHFLCLNTAQELNASGDAWIPVSDKYALAVARARRIGGKRYHTKRFGGGIVFQSYNIAETEKQIAALLNG